MQIADLGLNFGEGLPADLDFNAPPALFDVVLRSDELGLPGQAEQVFYEINTLTLRDPGISPVPLPAGLPMLLSALAGAAALRRFARQT